MAKLNKYINTMGTRLWALALFTILAVATVLLWNDQIGIGKLTEMAGGQVIPDIRFSYAPDDVYQLLHGLGPEGRKIYALFLMTADVIYPLLYTLFLAALLASVYRARFEEKADYRLLLLLPVAAGSFDILENISYLALILHYPGKLSVLAQGGRIVHLLKISFGLLSLAAIMAGSAANLWTWWYRKGRKRQP